METWRVTEKASIEVESLPACFLESGVLFSLGCVTD